MAVDVEIDYSVNENPMCISMGFIS